MLKRIKLVIILPLLVFASCSFQKWTMSKITSNLTNSDSIVFTGDDDPELIRDALPFTIKMYETLLTKDSTNPQLFLATGKLLCLYAQGFILFPADTLPDSLSAQKKAAGKRAKKLFLRGREYIFRGLDLIHPQFSRQIKTGSVDSALQAITPSDTAYLYWCAVSWMGAIAADRSDLGLSMSMKKALSLINRLSSLNETYGGGAINEFFCIFYTSAPKSMGGDTAAARIQLTKAITLSDDTRVSPFVTGASFLSVKSNNRNEFETFLNKALAVDINADPSQRLQNTIYQQRARWMLDNAERYFKE